MKNMVLMTILAATGSVVLAQQGSWSGAPVAGGTSAIPVVPSAATGSSTNAVNPWAELRGIQVKLQPIEENLVKSDPDIKALFQQCMDAQQALQELDKKRQDLIAAKLLADPAVAPLAKRRAELLAQARTMHPAGAPFLGATNRSSRTGGVPAPQAPAKTP